MRIGLVLSGGMAKGAYQIGALRALEEFIPREKIQYISCASVGVLNGYAYATGCLDRAANMWQNVCSDDSRLMIGQILRSSLLQQNIINLYNPKVPLRSTFYTSLLDLSHRNIVYKDLSSVEQKKLPLYLKASVAMPVYNRAVSLDNTSYYDGAMIDNIPVYPLQKHNLDYILCFYFDDTCYQFENPAFDKKIIKITFPATSMLRQSVIFRKDDINKMIQSGYDRTTQVLQSVFFKGYEDLDHIYRTIAGMNRTNAESGSLRITGDMLVTNLNKITKKLTKRKIL